MESLQDITRERDALAAHVERINGYAESCASELAWMIDRHNVQDMKDSSWLYDHQTPHELMVAVRSKPEVSLACRDARMKAEALEDMAKAVFDVPLIGECGRWMGVAALTMQHEAEKYRRQAEETKW